MPKKIATRSDSPSISEASEAKDFGGADIASLLQATLGPVIEKLDTVVAGQAAQALEIEGLKADREVQGAARDAALAGGQEGGSPEVVEGSPVVPRPAGGGASRPGYVPAADYGAAAAAAAGVGSEPREEFGDQAELLRVAQQLVNRLDGGA